ATHLQLRVGQGGGQPAAVFEGKERIVLGEDRWKASGTDKRSRAMRWTNRGSAREANAQARRAD
ncbi:MAG TPA: hypothetical protein VGH56_08745, partial [Solirubrobacteraceae bacterium]